MEGIYQLIEQGEYSWDVGLLAEIVYSKADSDITEIEIAGIFATELGSNMTFTTNLIAEYEKAERKMVSGISAQLKWCMPPEFEPAIKLYSD